MVSNSSPLFVCFVGSADFQRRMTAAANKSDARSPSGKIQVSGAIPSEAKRLIMTERPDVIVVEVGLAMNRQAIVWLRQLLEHFRDRFGRSVYIIAALTTPEKAVFAGDLLFQNEETLSPSGFIDNYIIAAPAGIPGIAAIEDQLLNCLSFINERRSIASEDAASLPALWDDGWVPAMCDPVTRNIWMRWLPRYARYVNENPIIVGPTGSGKTRLAAALHVLSGRDGPFVSITPRDFSSSELVQAELFGAVAGAYTGAVDKWGLVKKAEGGTLFIDELQSIDRDLQGKLITFIENKGYRRVGEADSHQADVRFIFATNRPLQDLVSDGSLRDDFAYRLERLQITLPPLQERRLDIAAGTCFALGKILRERTQALAQAGDTTSELFQSPIEGFSMDAYASLFAASWPGNLRQLENTIAKLVEIADIKQSRLIDHDCTTEALTGLLGQSELEPADIFENAAISIAHRARADGFSSITDCVNELTTSARITALEHTGGDIEQAAALISDSPKAMELFSATRTGDSNE